MSKIIKNDDKVSKKSLIEVEKLARNRLILILENIRSAYNVGAIFRTADAALVEKIILVGTTPVPPSTHIDKAALGATEAVPWLYVTTTEAAIQELRKKQYSIVALEQTDTAVTYHTLPPHLPMAIIVGNEIHGVEQETLNNCDYSIDIPMLGRASSLNVATAAGIVIYDILRQVSVNS